MPQREWVGEQLTKLYPNEKFLLCLGKFLTVSDLFCSVQDIWLLLFLDKLQETEC